MMAEKIELTQFLNQQYLCESLTINEVRTLIDYTELATYATRAIIAEIGDVGEALFFVISGEVSLSYQETPEQETEVARINPGELIGEMSFFDRRPRTVRMRAALDNTQLLRLTRPMYQRLRVEHPYIAVNLLEHAIISLDHLFRQVSHDVSTFTHYFYAPGKK